MKRFYVKLIIASGIGWLLDAMNVILLSYIVTVLIETWHLTIAQSGIIILTNSLGLLMGAILFGKLADIVGRTNTFIITLLIYSVFNGLSALSWDYTVFSLMRFFAGLGLGGELPVVASLVSEWGTENNRGPLVVLLESFWAYGVVAAGLISRYVLITIGWRLTLAILTALAVYALVIRFTIPESPRWLIMKGRVERARELIVKYGFSESMFKDITKVGIRGAISDLFSKDLRRRTVIAWILWFSIAFGYYGFLLWLPTALVYRGFSIVRSFTFSLIMTIFSIVGYYIAVYLINPLGRRGTLILLFLVSVVSALLFAYAYNILTLIISGSILNLAMSGIWGTIYAYTPELYPTSIRGVGTGSATAFARVGMIIGPYIPVLLMGNFNYTMIVITIVFLIGLLTSILAPETFSRKQVEAMR